MKQESQMPGAETLNIQVRPSSTSRKSGRGTRHRMIFDRVCTSIVGEKFILDLFHEMHQETLVAPIIYKDGDGHGIALLCDVHGEGIDRFLDELGDHGYLFSVNVVPLEGGKVA